MIRLWLDEQAILYPKESHPEKRKLESKREINGYDESL